jgi:hypothetical protein
MKLTADKIDLLLNGTRDAAGSGGPKGARNRNYKHGRYTAETIASRRWLRGRGVG